MTRAITRQGILLVYGYDGSKSGSLDIWGFFADRFDAALSSSVQIVMQLQDLTLAFHDELGSEKFDTFLAFTAENLGFAAFYKNVQRLEHHVCIHIMPFL